MEVLGDSLMASELKFRGRPLSRTISSNPDELSLVISKVDKRALKINHVPPRFAAFGSRKAIRC